MTRIPKAPAHVKGVLNLRGAVVPIFDLRERFELPRQDYSKETVVIVLRVNDGARSRIMGVVVDAVSDVLNVGTSEICEPPEFGAKLDTECIKGMVSAENKMVMLLDVDKLLSLTNSSAQAEGEPVAA